MITTLKDIRKHTNEMYCLVMNKKHFVINNFAKYQNLMKFKKNILMKLNYQISLKMNIIIYITMNYLYKEISY